MSARIAYAVESLWRNHWVQVATVRAETEAAALDRHRQNLALARDLGAMVSPPEALRARPLAPLATKAVE